MSGSETEHRAKQEANHLFSSAGAAIQGLRLRIENRVVVSLEDLYAGFQEARRKLEDGKYREAYDKYDLVYNQFGDRIGQWERKADARVQAVKNSHKPGKLEQLKTEIADVKKQSQGASRLLSRLRSALEPLSKLEDAAEVKPADPQTPAKTKTVRRARVVDESLLDFPDDEELPAKPVVEAVRPPQPAEPSSASVPWEFLEAFRAAGPGRRLAIVEQFFDLEREARMEMVQTAEKRMTVRFDPALKTGRFYLLRDGARVLRIDGLGNVLNLYDPEQDQQLTMPLKEFVGHARGGVWILRPKGGSGAGHVVGSA